MNAHRSEWSFSLALLWCILLSYLCLAPLSEPAVSLPYVDKLGHIVFFFLGGFLIAALPITSKQCVLAMLLLFGLGALLEVLQSLTAFRQAEWADLFADGFGAACGGIAMWLLKARRRKALQ